MSEEYAQIGYKGVQIDLPVTEQFLGELRGAPEKVSNTTATLTSSLYKIQEPHKASGRRGSRLQLACCYSKVHVHNMPIHSTIMPRLHSLPPTTAASQGCGLLLQGPRGKRL